MHQQKQKDFKKNMIKKEKHKNERKTEKQSIKTNSHSFKLKKNSGQIEIILNIRIQKTADFFTETRLFTICAAFNAH